jgi:hypothetical protein
MNYAAGLIRKAGAKCTIVDVSTGLGISGRMSAQQKLRNGILRARLQCLAF